MMIASAARHGPSVVVATVVLGALGLARTPLRSVPPPPLMSPNVATPPVDDSPVTIRGTAPYVSIDLDGDGTPELVARGESRGGAELVVATLDHRVLATVPLRASDFTVEGGELVVTHYDLGSGEVRSRQRLVIDHGRLALRDLPDRL